LDDISARLHCLTVVDGLTVIEHIWRRTIVIEVFEPFPGFLPRRDMVITDPPDNLGRPIQRRKPILGMGKRLCVPPVVGKVIDRLQINPQ